MEARQWAPSRDGSVVLDIGADIGAVVLHTPHELAGDEIEIRRTGKGARPTHTAVRSRRIGAHSSLAAVFPAVEAGEYTLHSVTHPALTPRCVTVIGGQVTEAHW
jgi:hypothetical protein